MTAPSCSVVVVSRHRPDALRRCLMGLEQLYHPEFEVILVADPTGLAVAQDMGLEARIKCVAFDEANISAARNLGIAQAAGDVIAFIDDDAVPEPTWLGRLIAGFGDNRVCSATGYVLGRNGISFQWRAMEVDALGNDHPLDVPPGGATLTAAPGRAIKTVGTNAAFRASTLRQIGGFDPAYRFFLDETDVNMRLAALGHAVAIVPNAQVHHGFAESAMRHANRAPRDLSEIGASTAVFLRRHAPQDRADKALSALRRAQEERLQGFVRRRALKPSDIKPLLQGLDAGIEAGRRRPIADPLPQLPRPTAPFLPFGHSPPSGHHTICGHKRHESRLMQAALKARAEGKVVSLFLFDATPRAHHVRFEAPGLWVQRGGVFGKSIRKQAKFTFWRGVARYRAEAQRVSDLREG
ncbi:glycosyltransferase family 2 protein [Alphaproteobacteria bacterium KMM 3653]|uniref:Glycosyltransferase family 2 protein n=1 Tax=Harenicola maris TaxID=2841044 RepID=A0AAP2G3V8_9RHOB|nr:glycosyltransferase family 2 protein [Harenicola maris]